MKRLGKFSVKSVLDAINELLAWKETLRSGDGLVQVINGNTFRLNIDRVRARIPKLTSGTSSSAVVWAICGAAAGSGASLLCFVGVTAYSSTAVYKIDDLAYYGTSVWQSLKNENKGNSPSEGEWWTAATPDTFVFFTLLGGISDMSDGHLSLVEGTRIPVMKWNENYWCIVPIEGTVEKACS